MMLIVIAITLITLIIGIILMTLIMIMMIITIIIMIAAERASLRLRQTAPRQGLLACIYIYIYMGDPSLSDAQSI